MAVKGMLGGAVNSCSDYHSAVVEGVRFQPFLAAVYMAYSEHRPLVLSPDGVWITIAQGVAHHMAVHGERLRERFVAHQGKKTLTFECDGWVLESPENPWAEAFGSWSGQIRDHVGARTHDLLRCDFSTTGPVEQAVSDVVMMDIFQKYFHFEAVCVCGIPSVTLEGTPGDWERLCEKAKGLSVFDMDWWLEHLVPICEQFARASRGDVDLAHWRGICKLREEYGGNIINGWIAKLFPYLLEYSRGPCNQRNPIFETGEGFQTLVAPSGLSSVPFTFKNKSGEKRLMQAIGGLIGISQDAKTLALRPKAGWAICGASSTDAIMERLAAEHTVYLAETETGIARNHFSSLGDCLPPDLGRFHSEFAGGAVLFANSSVTFYRILSQARMSPLDWGEDESGTKSLGPDFRTWHRLVDLADGSFLAINLETDRYELNPDKNTSGEAEECFSPICHCRLSSIGKAGKNPVVAFSFSELLQRLLDSGGKVFWRETGFKAYGDADEFIRRESKTPPKKRK